jgi:hypothetical protein
MRNKLHVIAGLLFLAALLFNLYVWGGLGRTRTMGPVVVDAAARELSLAGLYVPLGRRAVDAAGMSAASSEFAGEQFAAVEARVLANPQAAMETLLSEMPFAIRAIYYGAPLLLVVFAILYWRRPRVVQSMGRRR